MNKKIRFLLAMATCLTMAMSTTACDWFNGEEPDPQPDSTPGMATVMTADAEQLAAFNAEGVILYDVTEFSPLETTVTLETAYVFQATETVEEAKASEYANWIADYYVSVDTNVEAGKLGLAGNYGAYGWIAFYNPQALVANEQIGLLASAEGTPWKYSEIVESVGTFKCGAFDLDNACEGVKLTVELRLTNPDDATQTFTVCVTEYTF